MTKNGNQHCKKTHSAGQNNVLRQTKNGFPLHIIIYIALRKNWFWSQIGIASSFSESPNNRRGFNLLRPTRGFKTCVS